MNIKRSDITATIGLILAIGTMFSDLPTEAKSLVAGTSIVPTVWRFVDLLKGRGPFKNGDNIWYLANGLSVALPVAGYLLLAYKGDEVFDWKGLGEAFTVGASIAMGADWAHRKAYNDNLAKTNYEQIVADLDTGQPIP